MTSAKMEKKFCLQSHFLKKESALLNHARYDQMQIGSIEMLLTCNCDELETTVALTQRLSSFICARVP